MNAPQTIAPIDVAAVREARQRADLASKEAELTQLRVFVRYHLGIDDTFDLATGAITRATVPEAPPRA